MDYFATHAPHAQPFWQRVWDISGLEAAMRAPRETQQARLLEILTENAETAYGKEHQFASLRSISSFQREVPINNDERLRPFMQRSLVPGQPPQLTMQRPIFYVLSGGAGGAPRALPATVASINDYLAPAQMHAARFLDDHLGQQSGKILLWFGNDAAGTMPDGTPYGALSGFLARRQPALVRRFSALPAELARVTDLEQKYYLALRLALEQDIAAILIPNTEVLGLLAEGMERWADDLIGDIRAGTINRRYSLDPEVRGAVIPQLKPNPRRAAQLAERRGQGHGVLLPALAWRRLRAISCWKGDTLTLAAQRLARLYGPVPIREHGYISAEVWGSVPLSDAQQGGVLAVSSAFYEFLPEADLERIDTAIPLTCDQLEVGRAYSLIVTTSAGLYRFLSPDVLRVVDFYQDTPVIAFDRRREHSCSLAGEQLQEAQVTAALLLASTRLGLELMRATAAPRGGEPPGYVFTVECAERPADERLRQLSAEMESALQAQNELYAAARRTSALAAPVLRLAAPGAFTRFRQEQVSAGAPDDQIVLPHLSANRQFSESLAVIAESA